jgi:RimJ/RimL family protein N-acetyltransferase
MIRLLAPDDVGVFKPVRLEALRAEPGNFASSAADWENLPDEEWRRRLAAHPTFVAFVKGEPVGIIGLMRQQASKMSHRATLIMVYLRASERGKGIAGAMLNRVVEHARAEGVLQLELVVSSENPAAIRFYSREGFSEVGRIPGGFLHEGRLIDDVMMAKRIDG